jgi:hypothetical protein
MLWKQRQPDLTNAGYERWLRAQRPPFDWFLRLSELEQEQLAMLGDAHVQDIAVAIGYTVRDPEAADAGMSAMQGDADGEATLAARLAQGLANKLINERSPEEPRQPAQRTMSGFGSRKTAEASRPAPATLWGVEGTKA